MSAIEWVTIAISAVAIGISINTLRLTWRMNRRNR